jgi:hypothetical protein
MEKRLLNGAATGRAGEAASASNRARQTPAFLFYYEVLSRPLRKE